MSVHIVYEVRLLLYSFATGAGLMMTYDFLRILRIFIPHLPVIMGVEDMVYWVYASLVTFSLLYEQNDGSFRFYAVAGVFLGMAAYDRFVSRIFFRCLKKFSRWFKITRKGNSGS